MPDTLLRETATIPALLDFPTPHGRMYPATTVVAEKFEAMVKLRIANTRMKISMMSGSWRIAAPRWLVAFYFLPSLLTLLRMPLRRKRIFRLADPAPTTIYVRPGYNRVLAEQFEALKVKRAGLVQDKIEAHSQGDLRENFGFKAAKDAIRAVDRKMTALDRFVARNTFIEVDPAAWLTKSTDTLQLGHVITIDKQDVVTKRVHRFTFLVTTHGETASDPDLGIECLPHNSPLATAVLGLAVNAQTKVKLPAGESLLTVRAIRNPTQAELDRLLTAIQPPEIEDEEG